VSIAETVADRKHIPYRNIEMSPQHRAELGIPLLFTTDVPGSDFPSEQTAKWNALRESHMVDGLLDAVADARVLIVICRVSHNASIRGSTSIEVRPCRAVRRDRDAVV
jgi:hypothetical protein